MGGDIGKESEGKQFMKHGKNPTVKQKIMLKNYGLDPINWLIVKDCRECLEVVNRLTGSRRRLNRM